MPKPILADYSDSDEETPTTSRTVDNAAYGYFNSRLKSPKYVLAPMVDQSDLPWRMLARRHGADLCFTPMIHSAIFTRDNTYRCENITAVERDRPLIAQFCANEPEQFVNSIKLISEFVDGVDLNLGCPQMIAKRGNYGAFLMDSWALIYKMINAAVTQCPETPISAKIRIFEGESRTIEYAKMIEGAGAKMLTVHGRTRDMKGAETGLANWDIIKKVKDAVDIPVIANGNIQVHGDLKKCLEVTGADAVMSAEGHLHNPYIFEPERHETHWNVAKEYLEIVREYTAPMSAVRGHLFKLCYHSLSIFEDLRDSLAKATNLDDIDAFIDEIQRRCSVMHAQYLLSPKNVDTGHLILPHWLCQPYYRPLPGTIQSQSIIKQEQSILKAKPLSALDSAIIARLNHRKRKHQLIDNLAKQTGLSKSFVKKMEKKYNDDEDAVPSAEKLKRISEACLKKVEDKYNKYAICSCLSPMGAKCDYNLCKKCCKAECNVQKRNCTGHNWWFGDKTGLRQLMEKKARSRALANRLNDD